MHIIYSSLKTILIYRGKEMTNTWYSFSSKQEGIEKLKDQLLNQGYFYKDVAKNLGITKHAVYQICVDNFIDISERTPRWYAKNWHVPELENDSWLKEQERKGNVGLKSLGRQLGIFSHRLSRQIERLEMDPKDFYASALKKHKTLSCYNCGKVIKDRRKKLTNQEHVFCSRSCRSAWLGRTFGFGNRKHRWGDREDSFVKANWQTMSDEDMAKKLGFNPGTLMHHRSASLGLYRKGSPKPKGERMNRIKMGRLEVVTGCMFSGKTEELIRRLEREIIAEKARGSKGTERIIVFKPSIDARYGKGVIATHYGKNLLAENLVPGQESIEEIEKVIGSEKLKRATVIAFDEGQFFSDKLPGLCEQLVNMGKRVIVAGLDTTFAREPFGPMPNLMALADEVLKLHAVCVKCGGEATCTQRLVDGKPAPADGKVVLVGGTGFYEARCRKCYEKG